MEKVVKIRTNIVTALPDPTQLFIKVWMTTVPSVEDNINSSLVSGVVPTFCKEAVVEP